MQDRKRLEGVSRYLAGLSVPQRLAAGTLLVVMLATLVWLGARTPRGSGAAMEPLLNQSFAESDLLPITDRLRARSITHEVREGKVYVAADKRLDALSDLYYTAVLTGSGPGTGGVEDVARQLSAFDPPSKADKLFNRAREQTCERVIGRFRGVRKATVVIDPTNERHIGGASVMPSAMVDLQTQGEINARQLSSASINVLTGSVAQLTRDRVKVTIDGATYNSAGGDDDALAGADELMARKQQCEQMYVAKVRRLLSYIPDVVVSVSVDLNAPRAAAAAVRNADANKAAAQPPQVPPSDTSGTVVANAVPALIDAISSPSNAATKTREAAAGEANPKPRPPAGREVVRSASVVVPRSYFAAIYQRANRRQPGTVTASSAEPDDALLQPIIDAHLLRIRALVKNSLGLERDSDVTVEPYDDAAALAAVTPVAIAPPLATAGSAATVSTSIIPANLLAVLNAHPRTSALTVLGLATVLMLALLLHRRSVATMPPGSADRGTVVSTGPQGAVLSGTLEPASPVAPLAGATTGASVVAAGGMTGSTVEDSADAHRMFRRVRDVVAENPDDAARVLRGWIYQGTQ
jgi:flagellar biosynthesis/type III secretory pathway M-ring protein FliF/YscJ